MRRHEQSGRILLDALPRDSEERELAGDGEQGTGGAATARLARRRGLRWRRSDNGRRRRGDLSTRPLPAVTREDWADPEAALILLYRQAEAKAAEAIDWYLRERRPKKRASRWIRAAAILFAAAGGLQPLVSLARPGSSSAAWGYPLLGVAAACLAFDRFFGLSSGWMRCMLAAQHLQARLERFQYDWASAYLTGPAPTTERLALLREFTMDVGEVVQRETVEWEQEFQSNLARLEAQAALSGRDGAPSRKA